MAKRIKDEFTDLKISNQRKWQLRRAKEGKCIICGAKAADNSPRCLKHNVQLALRNHERKYPNRKPLNGKWLKLANVLTTQTKLGRTAPGKSPVPPRIRAARESR